MRMLPSHSYCLSGLMALLFSWQKSFRITGHPRRAYSFLVSIPKVRWEMVLHDVKIWVKAKYNPDQVSGISSGGVSTSTVSFFLLFPSHILDFLRKPQDEVGSLWDEIIGYTQMISVRCFFPSFPGKKEKINNNKNPTHLQKKLPFQTPFPDTPKEAEG